MDALLSRITLACGAHDVTTDEDDLLYLAALTYGSWDRLPVVVRQLVEEVETRPVMLDLVDGALVAAAGMEAHFYCEVDAYCRNPLHPGPCKGWTRQLGKNPADRADIEPVDNPRIPHPVPGNRPPAIPEDERRERRRIRQARRRERNRQVVQQAVQGLNNLGAGVGGGGGASRGRAASRSTSGTTRLDVNSQRAAQNTVAAAVAANVASQPTAPNTTPGSPGAAGEALRDGLALLRQSHGDRIAAGRSVNAQRAADEKERQAQDQIKAAATAMWTLDDSAKSGLKSEVTSVSVGRVRGDGSIQTSVSVRITNPQGRLVGTSTRSINTDVGGETSVYHSYLQLDASTQGGGFATRYNGQAFEAYEAAGVTHVSVSANLDVGGYTWATQGFDFSSKQSMQHIAAIFRRRRDRYAAGSPVQLEIDLLLSRSTDSDWAMGTHPTPYEWSQVGARCCARTTSGRRTWPGKSALLGTSWSGAKPIVGNLRSRPQGVPAGGVRAPEPVVTTPSPVAVSAGLIDLAAAADQYPAPNQYTAAFADAGVQMAPSPSPNPRVETVDYDVEWETGEGWTERQDFLEAVWQNARAYGDEVADDVPACQDAEGQATGDDPTNVPEFHHLMCAAAPLDEVLTEIGEDLLDEYGRELADG